MKKQSGFTLVEIMIVVAIIGLLAAIAIPSFMKARTTSQAKACVNNLRQIESGKEQWALATGQAQGAEADSATNKLLINGYIKASPVCPVASATYNYQVIGTNATCSVGSNATDSAASHVLP